MVLTRRSSPCPCNSRMSAVMSFSSCSYCICGVLCVLVVVLCDEENEKASVIGVKASVKSCGTGDNKCLARLPSLPHKTHYDVYEKLYLYFPMF
mmetsp:Transcript_3205/g.5905  ORF Transcript_3205/g.5905 Transcript_3205/m.5905 type:complete len:94 (+) Transcript_3205:723-1004(+)